MFYFIFPLLAFAGPLEMPSAAPELEGVSYEDFHIPEKPTASSKPDSPTLKLSRPIKEVSDEELFIFGKDHPLNIFWWGSML